MGCSTSLVSTLVFVFNFICSFVGLALITIGSLALDRVTQGSLFVDSHYLQSPILILTIGIAVFFVSFLGCCGAFRESSCLLTTYAVILLSLFIFQLVVGIYSYIVVKNAKFDIEPLIKKSMESEIMLRYQENFAVRRAFDKMQRELYCCGTDGPQSWDAYNIGVPSSCCEFEYNCSSYWERGCVRVLSDTLAMYLRLIAWIALGVSITEILGSIFGFYLANSIKNRIRRQYM